MKINKNSKTPTPINHSLIGLSTFNHNDKNMIKNPLQEKSTQINDIIAYTNDIIDKQYRSYTWNDTKVQALITIDTALIAGILLIFQIYSSIYGLVLYIFGFSFGLLIISSLICLYHSIPQINSKIGNEDNLRTMVGIKNYTKEEYHTRILKLNLKTMVKMNCNQISGMCKNNMRSYNLIKRGAYLTIIGVILIAIAISMLVYTKSKTYNPSSINSSEKAIQNSIVLPKNEKTTLKP